MNAKRMSKFQAEEKFDLLINTDFVFNEKLDLRYNELRERLVKEYEKILYVSDKEYFIDLHFGLELYKLTNELFDLSNNISLASDIDFWIYINMCVIPDLVFDRWGTSKVRFYNMTKRVWTNTLWWYIHLSWQGDANTTRDTIKRFTTDTIVQLVERTSGKGYNLELARTIIRQLGKLPHDGTLIRRVLVLNTFYSKNIEPSLFQNGVDSYVKMLFDKSLNR